MTHDLTLKPTNNDASVEIKRPAIRYAVIRVEDTAPHEWYEDVDEDERWREIEQDLIRRMRGGPRSWELAHIRLEFDQWEGDPEPSEAQQQEVANA